VKWHEQNPEDWHTLSALCAVDQGFQLDNARYEELHGRGMIYPQIIWHLSEDGKRFIEACDKKLDAEHEADKNAQ
jgi:hypothetical protein